MEYTVNLWDEGIHTVLSTVTVRGTKENVLRIMRAELEGQCFIAPRRGCASTMSASEFIRRFVES